MALKPYLVQRPLHRSVDGVTALAVMAADATGAKAIANSYTAKDRPGARNNATVTEIAATSTDLIGYAFRFVLSQPDGDVVVDVTVTGDATNNTIDEIAALAVTALNATTPIAGAAYNSTTQVLKVAETTDSLGDHQLIVEVRDANGNLIPGVTAAGLVGTIVDGGASGDAVTVTLKADADVTPVVVAAAGAF